MRTAHFQLTVNRELSAKFPGIRFNATYSVGETEISNTKTLISSRKFKITADTVISVKLADDCSDQVLAKLKDGFPAESQKPNFETVKDLIAVS
jgi:hypothetical protein